MRSENWKPSRLKIPFDCEAALLSQSEWAQTCRIPLQTTHPLGLEFIVIPPGEFLCGGSGELDQELRRQGLSAIDEPRYECILTKPMSVGIHRVTQDQYQELMGINPSAYAATGYHAWRLKGVETGQLPVEGVSWYDCIEACNKLSELEDLPSYYRFDVKSVVIRNPNGAIVDADVEIIGGGGFRLLTSAEWEWVARAGTTTVHHYGNKERGVSWKKALGRPWPVGSVPPNTFGVFDLHMYALEWTFDAYSYEDIVQGPLIDPVDLVNVDDERVARGLDCFARVMEVASAAESRNFRFCRTIDVE